MNVSHKIEIHDNVDKWPALCVCITLGQKLVFVNVIITSL